MCFPDPAVHVYTRIDAQVQDLLWEDKVSGHLQRIERRLKIFPAWGSEPYMDLPPESNAVKDSLLWRWRGWWGWWPMINVYCQPNLVLNDLYFISEWNSSLAPCLTHSRGSISISLICNNYTLHWILHCIIMYHITLHFCYCNTYKSLGR